jgi:ketosteroid isomerase-like protein
MNNNVMTRPSEVVRDFLQGLLLGLPKGNMGAVDQHMTPDVEMIVVGTTSPELLEVLPWGGKHVGPEAVKKFFVDLLGRNVQVLTFGIDEIIEQDASVALFGVLQIQARQTGIVIESEYALRIKIRDGQIARYHLFENSYHVATAFRVAGAWEVETAEEGRRTVPAPTEGLM